MLNGYSHDRRHRFNQSEYDHLRKNFSSLLRQAFQFQTTADLALKVPLILGAILVLLAINTALQYAAGPVLHRALPAHGGSGSSQQHANNPIALSRHIPAGLVTDVVPGGADAELLCVDKQTVCEKE